ncbi:hypothetical protein ACIBIZ_19170 [Nonomuraea spiralis]|uniref:hypothetical protein n=1 Tax=Nonomuraea spiralis TaxID=46182 RepID=UPI00100152B3|nr:hypothetical protein DMB42_37500 [Nonomuraea sp. WAC 01424]
MSTSAGTERSCPFLSPAKLELQVNCTALPSWEPHVPRGLLRVVEASCCEEYVLCFEAAQFFVRRVTGQGAYEETARGPYARAAAVWGELAGRHVCRNQTGDLGT